MSNIYKTIKSVKNIYMSIIVTIARHIRVYTYIYTSTYLGSKIMPAISQSSRQMGGNQLELPTHAGYAAECHTHTHQAFKWSKHKIFYYLALKIKVSCLSLLWRQRLITMCSKCPLQCNIIFNINVYFFK